jgi:murein hydrolase activator
MKNLRSISFCLFLFLGFLATPLFAEDDIARTARASAKNLDAATTEMVFAKSAKNRIKALAGTIRAFEEALALLRASMRQIAITQAGLETNLTLQEEGISRLVGVLHGIDNEPITAKLVHPDGPLSTARAGMLLSAILPTLQRPINELRQKLENIKTLQTIQKDTNKILQNGLNELQSARSNLASAMADRKDLPKRFIEDKSKTAILIAAAETLDTFISGLSIVAIDEVVGSLPDIRDRKGTLPFPVNGRILREFKSADAAGIARPGIIVATTPGALVSTPTAATIRYNGELLDYGLVSILEPQRDVLFIFSGLTKIFGNIGEVLPTGSPIGVMGGELPSAGKMLKESAARSGAYRPETLYIEIRENETPQDPLLWFQIKKD